MPVSGRCVVEIVSARLLMKVNYDGWWPNLGRAASPCTNHSWARGRSTDANRIFDERSVGDVARGVGSAALP